MKQNTTNSPKANVLTRTNFFSKREMSELPLLLMPDERVLAVLSGFYTAGTAILCVTSHRLLLVDKKMVRLSFEDIRFESIREVNFSHQAIMASVKFIYAGREMQFRSWYKSELRMLAQLVQQKMFDVRDKSHQKNTTLENQITQAEETNQLEPEIRAESTKKPTAIDYYANNEAIDKYLSERIARWRKATRFVDTLTMSTKAGKQILKFEAPVAKR